PPEQQHRQLPEGDPGGAGEDPAQRHQGAATGPADELHGAHPPQLRPAQAGGSLLAGPAGSSRASSTATAVIPAVSRKRSSTAPPKTCTCPPRNRPSVPWAPPFATPCSEVEPGEIAGS